MDLSLENNANYQVLCVDMWDDASHSFVLFCYSFGSDMNSALTVSHESPFVTIRHY